MHDSTLRAQLTAALAAKGPEYLPRTRHKLADGSPRYTNRLILASSPYLAQHAHNPVDWWPWCDEAFSTAETQSKPVLLSVGYSTCHWCHVMEEESFEDEEIARFVNERFVCVKVDREERPDVDAVYMSFIQGMTGRGGWPMTVFLTPSRQPFYGATYLPPRAGARGARQGLLEVLRIIDERYRGDPRAILAQSELYSNELRTLSRPAPAGDLAPASTIDAAVAQARASFDPTHGGRRGIPKFPSAFPLRLLCRYGVRSGDERALSMVSHTLERMADGGMFDHLSGGFHRYSTDHQWLVPHFEKMLYDNAALALAYLEGSQALANPRFADTTRSVLDYVLAEMTAPDGTFYAATDADSATPAGVMEEGAFFTWTTHEIESALGVDDAPDAIAYWGVSETGHLDGRSVLHRPRGAPALDPARVESLRARLREARAKRPAPLRDDKAIIGWNALTVTALARAAIVLGDARYADAAVRCCETILRVRDERGSLPHVIVRGQGEGLAYGDDRVFLSQALLDVFELTGHARWLDEARATMNDLAREHGDPENGGYFLSATSHEALLFREKPDYDGAVPSLNSVAALVWSRLATVCDDELARGHAERTMRAFSALVARRPLAMDHLLLALDWHTRGAREVVIVVREGGALSGDARPFLAALERSLVPSVALVVATEAALAGALGERVPFARGKTLVEGRPTAYVCERGLCQRPTTDPEEFAAQLRAS
ncbi:MAG: thioredoxin domain-containing protein [Myxococcales bacterium]|nr:thioredoxin domain-containing protein [Myxococcales bacterium]